MNFNLLDHAEYRVGILKKKKEKKEKKIEGTQFFNADRSKRGIWFLKKKGFKWIFAEGDIVCSGRNHTVHPRHANRHVADSEKATIAGLTNRKQIGEGGRGKRKDNNRRKLEIRNPAPEETGDENRTMGLDPVITLLSSKIYDESLTSDCRACNNHIMYILLTASVRIVEYYLDIGPYIY